MARSPYFSCSVPALALVFTMVQTVYSQTFTVPTANSAGQKSSVGPRDALSSAQHTDGRIVRKVYGVRDLGDDPAVGKWLAQAIPSLIQPGRWDTGEAGSTASRGKGKLVYNAAARLLVVQHNAAVQCEVAAFLKEVKQALPGRHPSASVTAARDANTLVSAGYSTPALLKPGTQTPEKSSYLIPAPAKPPKHLFHLIIRYEGDGVVDANIANVFQSLYGQEEDDKAKSPPAKDGDKKPSPQAGKTPAPSQVFNFILRYEGEGIIDSTVAGMFKDLYRQMNGPAGYPTPTSVPAGAIPFAAPMTPGDLPMNPGVPAGPPTPVSGEIKLLGGKAQVESELAAADPSDRVQQQSKCKVFTVALRAGRTYEIEMIRKDGKGIRRVAQFDPFLRLEDSAGRQLMMDDDSAGNLNARIVFVCPQDGSFRVVATCLHGTGHFTLRVRESGATRANVPVGAVPPYTVR